MELLDFLLQTHDQVREQVSQRLGDPDESYPYPELVFAEVVMEHMAEIGMTFEPQVCHCSTKIRNAFLRMSGYAISEDGDQLDLFVSLYEGGDVLSVISDTETKAAADQCLRFLNSCARGELVGKLDQTHEAFVLAQLIKETYSLLDQIRIYVLTDRQAKSKNFKSQEIGDKTIRLEVMDIERLHRHWSEGKPRDEVVVNFEEVSGSALPCIYVPNEMVDYDYALTVIPGDSLRFIYEKYGARLLEANVRSFLSVTGNVNKGVRDTLRTDPEHFMAYNNGIVLVADEISLGNTNDGSVGIVALKGLQIVNGGQTTASIYFTKKKHPETDLSRVRVPAKLIILRSCNDSVEEALISSISKYANTQNTVRQSDLAANKPFHVAVEKLALSTYCPDGIARWFYERAAGSYNTMLAREGTTPAKLKHIKTKVTPPSRKIGKTDLAKYLNSWDQKPHIVSLGSQKNFERFMEQFRDGGTEDIAGLPDVSEYKRMIAKTILFKKAQALIRPMFPAFQGNVTVYVVSLLAFRLGNSLDLMKVWNEQDISLPLRRQIQAWAREVNEVMTSSSGGRMLSEWAKKPDCWEQVRLAPYSAHADDIPELR